MAGWWPLMSLDPLHKQKHMYPMVFVWYTSDSDKEHPQNHTVIVLTFEHSDSNGSAIWTDAVAANTHVSAWVRYLDVGDEQSTDVGAVHSRLERIHWVRRLSIISPFTSYHDSAALHFWDDFTNIYNIPTHINHRVYWRWSTSLTCLTLFETQIWHY